LLVVLADELIGPEVQVMIAFVIKFEDLIELFGLLSELFIIYLLHLIILFHHPSHHLILLHFQICAALFVTYPIHQDHLKAHALMSHSQ